MKKYIAIMLITLTSSAIFAQKVELGVNYNLAVPLGEYENFIQANSYLGASVNFRYYIKPRLSVGADVEYQFSNKKFDKQTYYFDNGAVNMVHYRFGNHAAVLAQLHYAVVDAPRVRLTGGLGMGLAYLRQEVWLGQYEISTDNFGFQLSPEAELDIKATDRIGFRFTSRYNAAFNAAKTDLKGESHPFQSMEFRFGAYFLL